MPQWRIIAAIGLASVIVIGIGLRLSFPNDIEYKLDEAGYLESSLHAIGAHAWPWLGPPSSIGSPSPGLGTGVITILTFVSGAHTGPQVAHAVQVTNSVALVAFVAFIFLVIPPPRREYWLWAASLWAVNPIAVILERKIWPVSTLPIFTVALLAAWSYRKRFAAAFAWGLCGMLMSQVHIGAVFFVISLIIWSAASDWRAVNWGGWLIGSALGSFVAIPWVISFLSFADHGSSRLRWPIPSFYLRWPTQPFGLGVEYTLGPAHMFDFLRGPVLFGYTTYLMTLLYAALGALLITAFVSAARRLWRLRESIAFDAQTLLLGRDADALLVRVALIGYGGFLTLLTVFGPDSHRHYMIVITPIMSLWAARLIFFAAGPRPRFARYLLAASCIGQAALSFGLLDYIHVRQVIHGEFGPTWHYQEEHCPPAEVGHRACLRAVLNK